MLYRSSIGAIALVAALCAACAGAQAFDDANYPDLKGQWTRLPAPGIVGVPSFDPTKRAGRDQQAPLTPEYQKRGQSRRAGHWRPWHREIPSLRPIGHADDHAGL
jgi:hypothetical protein